MKYVNSGCGKVPLITTLAILSISLVVNLPGLAITPIMGKLDKVFPHVTDLEIQLLSVLPNLIIIPFILLSGKIATQKTQMWVMMAGMAIFAVTGIIYLFADSILLLILLGCVLGIGCGLVIPLAASFISQTFKGEARARVLGLKSGISNVTVIFATLFVGWIAAIDWHMAFLVYLMPLIPLAMVPFMTDRFMDKYVIPGAAPDPHELDLPDPQDASHLPLKPAPMDEKKLQSEEPHKPDTSGRPKLQLVGKRSLILLAALIGVYITVTYASMAVSYNLPFTMQFYKLSTGTVGVATALYFAAASASGFALQWIKKLFGRYTIQISTAIMAAGLYCVGIFHTELAYYISILAVGLGYGVIQPVIYNKTTYIAPNDAASTRYFSYLLTGNYIGIAMVPFLVDFMAKIFRMTADPNFAFILNGCVSVILLIIAIWCRKDFVFRIGRRIFTTPAK